METQTERTVVYAAFRSGEGMIVLDPRDTFTASWGIAPE
jgi:hypothetical protein